MPSTRRSRRGGRSRRLETEQLAPLTSLQPGQTRPAPNGIGYVGICAATHRDGEPCAAEFWDDRPKMTLCSACRMYQRGRRRRQDKAA